MKTRFLLSVLAVILLVGFAGCYDEFFLESSEVPASLAPPPVNVTAAAPEATSDEGPAEDSDEGYVESTFPFAFSTYDLHGNTVTEADLGNKELFFVYFWATWCFACVQGMPTLAELHEEFGDRIGFLTLMDDFDTGAATAITAKENASAEFITVDARLDYFEELLPLVRSGFVPTSIIIDADGNVVGEQIVGGSARALRSAIRSALD
ncbi:MAG: TlpA family protein disulfide reductase [Defluviitaleaceae bacterium]|nr:TlpA family protein disulfide reductase [Defluviitaleaceae bacterium]